MADKDKIKDSHRKDFISKYNEYLSQETHHFDMATKQWVKSTEFYKKRRFNA